LRLRSRRQVERIAVPSVRRGRSVMRRLRRRRPSRLRAGKTSTRTMTWTRVMKRETMLKVVRVPTPPRRQVAPLRDSVRQVLAVAAVVAVAVAVGMVAEETTPVHRALSC
jgi:hypothetical protein